MIERLWDYHHWYFIPSRHINYCTSRNDYKQLSINVQVVSRTLQLQDEIHHSRTLSHAKKRVLNIIVSLYNAIPDWRGSLHYSFINHKQQPFPMNSLKNIPWRDVRTTTEQLNSMDVVEDFLLLINNSHTI